MLIHNFSSNEVVERLKITVEMLDGYLIHMGTNLEVDGIGICWNITARWKCMEVYEYFGKLYNNENSTTTKLY